MQSFLDLAKSRFSVRKFKPQPIETEKLTMILEAGRAAPTASNHQPQRIKVITDPEDLAKVDQCTTCRFNAPAVLLVCYDKAVSWTRKFDGASSGEVDAAIVTTHLMLEAQDLGIGSCWVMYFDPVKTAELFNLPENLVPIVMMPIGYPANDAMPAIGHVQRKPLEDTCI